MSNNRDFVFRNKVCENAQNIKEPCIQGIFTHFWVQKKKGKVSLIISEHLTPKL